MAPLVSRLVTLSDVKRHMAAIRHGIEIDMEALAEICRRFRVRELSLFGSVLRDDFHAGSDIDVLVEFEPDARISLFDVAALEDELSTLVGNEVHLVEKPALKRYLRDEILASAEVLIAD